MFLIQLRQVMVLKFNCMGNAKQMLACAAWVDRRVLSIVYGGSKGSGKTYLGCSLIFADALMYPGTMYFIARKELNDLRKYTIPSIKEVFTRWGIDARYWKFNGLDSYFTLYNGSRVYFLECKDRNEDPMGQRYGSTQFTRGWIEEAGEVSITMKNALQITIGRWRNSEYNLAPKLLMTCNPSRNFLYSDYYRPFIEGSLEENKAFIQALPQDNRTLGAEYIENLRQTLTGSEKMRLLDGCWEYETGEDCLVSWDVVEQCFNNKSIEKDVRKIFISADIALMGRDRFVVFVWYGNVAVLVEAKANATASQVQDAIERICSSHGISASHCVADADGLGSYLGSYVKGIVPFHSQTRALNSKLYKNKKSECAYALARWINNGTIRIECSSHYRVLIAEELMQLRCSGKDALGKRGLVSKDDMRNKINRSPDFLDALIMGMHFHVQPEPNGIEKINVGSLERF
jgi:hypothetical protein